MRSKPGFLEQNVIDLLILTRLPFWWHRKRFVFQFCFPTVPGKLSFFGLDKSLVISAASSTLFGLQFLVRRSISPTKIWNNCAKTKQFQQWSCSCSCRLRAWLDALAFSLSGLDCGGTTCAAMAFTMEELHWKGSRGLAYPKAGQSGLWTVGRFPKKHKKLGSCKFQDFWFFFFLNPGVFFFFCQFETNSPPGWLGRSGGGFGEGGPEARRRSLHQAAGRGGEAWKPIHKSEMMLYNWYNHIYIYECIWLIYNIHTAVKIC